MHGTSGCSNWPITRIIYWMVVFSNQVAWMALMKRPMSPPNLLVGMMLSISWGIRILQLRSGLALSSDLMRGLSPFSLSLSQPKGETKKSLINRNMLRVWSICINRRLKGDTLLMRPNYLRKSLFTLEKIHTAFLRLIWQLRIRGDPEWTQNWSLTWNNRWNGRPKLAWEASGRNTPCTSGIWRKLQNLRPRETILGQKSKSSNLWTQDSTKSCL